jgi:two-component system cell cycle response regulator
MKNGFNAGVTDYYDKTQGYKNLIHFIRDFVERNAPLKGKVLYLEDNHSEAMVIMDFMRRRGLEVVHTVSAEHALEILDRSFDLVVLDFYLEGDLSGGDFLHIARCGRRRSREDLPVLVITANDDPDIQPEIFHAGGSEFITKPVMEEVLAAKLRGLLQLKRHTTRLRQQAEQIENLAIQDRLTKTHNRQFMLDNAQRLLDDKENYPVWLALLELDHFNSINDSHGILAGDQVLQGVGELLKSFLNDKDVIARTGSKEFMIMMMRRSHEECLTDLEDLRRGIEQLQPAGFLVTASIGVASNLGHTHIRFHELWAEANRAMHRAKDRGHNRVVLPGGLRSSDRMLMWANRKH